MDPECHKDNIFMLKQAIYVSWIEKCVVCRWTDTNCEGCLDGRIILKWWVDKLTAFFSCSCERKPKVSLRIQLKCVAVQCGQYFAKSSFRLPTKAAYPTRI